MMPLDGLVLHFNVVDGLVLRELSFKNFSWAERSLLRFLAAGLNFWASDIREDGIKEIHNRAFTGTHAASVKLETPFQTILATRGSWLNMETCEMKCLKLNFNEQKLANTNKPRIVKLQPSF